ncbi:MAG: ATP-binding protein [Gammaproteobacteria bacterium]
MINCFLPPPELEAIKRQAAIDRLFDAFYTTKAGGLGLAISRTIVENHGRKLWATCGTDSGVKLYFTLPIEST